MENNIGIKKVLNAKEAREYLGCSEYTFEQEIKKGNISFKQAGRIRLFPIWVLDQWLKDTKFLTNYSNAETRTMRTSQSFLKQKNEYDLEKVLEQWTNNKQLTTASKGLQRFKRNPNNKHLENFQV